MTILTLNAPNGRECEYHIWTNVVSCDDLYIVLRDGTRVRKSICAKVELLSVGDVPDYVGAWHEYVDPMVEEFCNEHGFTAGLSYINIGKKENFENLDLLTHI